MIHHEILYLDLLGLLKLNIAWENIKLKPKTNQKAMIIDLRFIVG